MQAAQLGYKNLFVYAEGMPVWEEAGYPFIKGPGYEAKVETKKILPKELNALLHKDKDAVIIVDVRDAYEFDEGHIPGAVNIPVVTFSARSDALDKKKNIIVYCNAGGRSYKAYRKLMKLGYKKYFQALFADWKEAGFPVEKKDGT